MTPFASDILKTLPTAAMQNIYNKTRENVFAQNIDTTHYYAQLGIPDDGPTLKGLVDHG